MSQTIQEKNKALVLDAFDTLFNKKDYTAAERFWSPNYIQHSAHIPPGRNGLFNLIKASPPSLRYEHGLIMAEGDFVIVHGRYSNTGLPANWIVADIVRIENGVLAEHWDVIQDEATQASSKSGHPMFGNKFPKLRMKESATNSMSIRRINVERVTVTSRRSLQDVLAKFDGAVGRPNIEEFWKRMTVAKTNSEMEKVVQSALGPSGFMEFARFDHGGVVHKGETGDHPKVFRLVIGNPLIMREMVKHVPDAGSYAPVTILIDERPDGVHISYDRMASLLALYENAGALKVAKDLDGKVEALLAAAVA